MTKTKKKLALATESIQTLTPATLQHVVGGIGYGRERRGSQCSYDYSGCINEPET